jgi:quercetin dioxygenase-like cupin family protein
MKNAGPLAALLVLLLLPSAARAQMPHSEIVFENASVRIAVLTFSPGGATGRHQGIEAEIGIVIEGDLTVESPTGRQALKAGGVYWMPGLTPHDVRNESARPARLYDIFLKRCD